MTVCDIVVIPIILTITVFILIISTAILIPAVLVIVIKKFVFLAN